MHLFEPSEISSASSFLAEGKTLVFPTETTYGLGCDATSQVAVDTIFTIKGRPSDKPLLIIVPTVEVAAAYLVTNSVFTALANRFWPGPLTIVGEYKNDPTLPPLARGVVSSSRTVAVRVSAFPFLQELVNIFNSPLVATSANVSGLGELYDPTEIKKMFAGQIVQPDALVDMGKLPVQAPTTVVDIASGKAIVLRQGNCVITDV